MTPRYRRAIPAVIAAVALIVITGCTGDLNRNNAPVALVLTQTQNLNRFDIAPGAAGCNVDFSTVEVRSLITQNPNLPSDPRFTDVQLTSYRVSYQRRDGGTLVPASFTQATSGLVSAGGTTSLNKFVVLRADALNQAPFAALTPAGGGRDPETGQTSVTMDIILEVFGETLSGQRVSGSTRMTMRFCFSCGGCA